MINEQQAYLVIALPESDYGRAYFAILNSELKEIEDKFGVSAKISNDPIQEDFRYQMGLIEGLKRALRKPQEIRELYQRQGENQ